MTKASTALRVLTIATAVGLLGCYVAGFFNPSRFWLLEYAALGTLPMMLANVFWLLVWATRPSKWALVPLVALVAGYQTINRLVQLRPRTQAATAQVPLRVLSFNVKNFAHERPESSNDRLSQTEALLRSLRPDVVCIQECYVAQRNAMQSLARLQRAGFAESRFFPRQWNRKMEQTGLAVLSRYPIIETEMIDFGPTTLNGAIRIDVMTARGRVRVFNIHLQSNRFGSIETEMIAANPQREGTTRPQKVEGGVRILSRLKEAALLRSAQAERMAGLIAQSQYPVVLCGDFNDTPGTYVYTTMTARLRDAFIARGNGIAPTYNGGLPTLRIDNVLASPILKPCDYRVVHSPISDHFPVFVLYDLSAIGAQ